MSLVELKKDTVAILVPCGGPIEPRAFQSLTAVASFSTANGYPVTNVGVTDRTLVHTARNILSEEFLKSDNEWAFWADSDMILEPRTIPVMMKWAKKLGAKMLTGVYYQRLGKHRPLVMIREKNRKYNDEYEMSFVAIPPNGNSAFKIDACGFGCVLMHRDMFDGMKKPYFRNIFFEDTKDGDFEYKEFSEDFYFCRKARELGNDIYAIPELDCGHIGQAPIIRKADFKLVEEAR